MKHSRFTDEQIIVFLTHKAIGIQNTRRGVQSITQARCALNLGQPDLISKNTK
jgi:hypothetical protein